jgi:hypothetical protein
MTDTGPVTPAQAPAAPASATAITTVDAAGPFWWPAPRVFIVGWMMISSFVLVVLCWWRPPPAENQIVTMLISVYVSTGFVTALNWWMGSSKGSDDKSTAINKQLNSGT